MILRPSLLLPALLVAGNLHAAPVDFVRDVEPLLKQHCHGCHGAEKQRGGLRLDRKDDALAGGDSGVVIVVGKSNESLLIRYIRGTDKKKIMPPRGERLTAEEVATLAAWIEQGAMWPDSGESPRTTSDHWAFQPIRRPTLPDVKDAEWVRNPIDRFILARLEKEGVAPSPEADRRTLIRRLSLDLVGLPPTPHEVDAFEKDSRPDAYDRLVEKLLSSPHFGERWGRHWLDLARYADSDGYENDRRRPNAWRFRDWVIHAINGDMPFDRFTIEQIAGDLLPDATLGQKIAAGFHRHTLYNSAGGADREEFRIKAVKDRVNTTSTVWLGLTAGCAQCHSHKYDPLTQREYYGLFAFFNDAGEADAKHPQGGEVSTFTVTRRESHVNLRGDFLRPGPTVEPHTPAFLPSLKARDKRADRLDLAQWIASRDNPLSPRVAVNHVWQHLLGQPLVATPDNFGKNGAKPTQPELLDGLASEFLARKWSRKEMIRLVVTSATYRQSSVNRPELHERDPANTWLARQNRFRVEAEIVRDLALSASGLLEDRVGGPSVQPPLPAGLTKFRELKNETFVEASKGKDQYRRGVYIHVQRTFPYPSLLTFDAPDGNETCPKRDRSTTPLQALTLRNDPVFVECAQALGKRILAEGGSDFRSRLGYAWQVCLGRAPTAEEATVVEKLLAHHMKAYKGNEAAAWAGIARTLLNLDEFITRE